MAVGFDVHDSRTRLPDCKRQVVLVDVKELAGARMRAPMDTLTGLEGLGMGVSIGAW